MEKCYIMYEDNQTAVKEGLLTPKVNVLVASNVIEGGLDMQDCSCIIHFDSPNTVCGYIQSRGLACNPKSDYVAFVERYYTACGTRYPKSQSGLKHGSTRSHEHLLERGGGWRAE
ncbi:hypothetical protein KI387_012751, partial [Taxus chinensis]